jgi:predicted transglutaminase-like cysteine proteinase
MVYIKVAESDLVLDNYLPKVTKATSKEPQWHYIRDYNLIYQ